MSTAHLTVFYPHLCRVNGRRIWCNTLLILGESVNGGWFAARPMGGAWGLHPPHIDCMPTAEAAIDALEIYDAIQSWYATFAAT